MTPSNRHPLKKVLLMYASESGRPASFKVVFLGNASTGKTSIIRRYCDNAFTEDQPPTIGSAFVTRPFSTDAGLVQLQIWDTAGEERYRSLVPMYSRGAAVAVVVFDISNRESFDDVETWIHQVRNDVNPRCRILLAGNKLDLRPEIPLLEVEKWATEREYSIIWVSALSGQNITFLFEKIGVLLPRALSDLDVADDVNITEPAADEGACC
jgi:small GTP-binding protein